MEEDIVNSARKFLDLFEEVFDRDWAYSKEMMGIEDLSGEQKRIDKEVGLETIEIISSEGTFINPQVEDETEDWGNRGALLQEFRKLKEMLHV